ncbi:hypothetical protein C8R44DRAFT_855000 [Mycena epipterygia]|nr:hypothetical protein C8R44DRAFT_855000 [Mycena epipterygia]
MLNVPLSRAMLQSFQIFEQFWFNQDSRKMDNMRRHIEQMPVRSGKKLGICGQNSSSSGTSRSDCVMELASLSARTVGAICDAPVLNFLKPAVGIGVLICDTAKFSVDMCTLLVSTNHHHQVLFIFCTAEFDSKTSLHALSIRTMISQAPPSDDSASILCIIRKSATYKTSRSARQLPCPPTHPPVHSFKLSSPSTPCASPLRLIAGLLVPEGDDRTAPSRIPSEPCRPSATSQGRALAGGGLMAFWPRVHSPLYHCQTTSTTRLTNAPEGGELIYGERGFNGGGYLRVLLPDINATSMLSTGFHDASEKRTRERRIDLRRAGLQRRRILASSTPRYQCDLSVVNRLPRRV